MKSNRTGTFLGFSCETLIVRGTISDYNKEDQHFSVGEGAVKFQIHVLWMAK